MNIIRATALFATSLLMAYSVMASAQAALIHNLTTSFGSGQITFINDNGGTDVNDVAAFSFDVNAGNFGGPQSYGIPDIATIDWSIGPDWGLTINLVSFFKPFSDGRSAITLVNDGINANSPCTNANTTFSSTCEQFPGGASVRLATLSTEALHVPEPSTSLVYAVGLIFLVWLQRRRFSLCRRRLLGDFV